MMKFFMIFLFIIFNSNFSLAKNKEKITVEEIRDIFLYSEQAIELNNPGETHDIKKKRFDKLKKSGTIEKRIKNRGIAKCLYKNLLEIDSSMYSGGILDADYLASVLFTDPNAKECISKTIRIILSYPEKSKKRRPGDIFYALEAIERLVFDSRKKSKFVGTGGVYMNDDGKRIYSYSKKEVEPEVWPKACVKWLNSPFRSDYLCTSFDKKIKKKIAKFKEDPSDEKVLGKPLIKYIKNVRMVRGIREQIGNTDFALLGDMLNAIVVDVKKNNIIPDLKIRRVLLKKYSLILNDIKKNIDEDNYKSINKKVSTLSKTYNDLNALTTTKEIVVNIDKAVDSIFDLNKTIQITVLDSKNNEEKRLLALSTIYFMKTLIDSILSIIPEKYYTETKELSPDLFNETDLLELEVIINLMIKNNNEIKSVKLAESMDMINKSFNSINTSNILKKFNNLGMKNILNRKLTQNTVSQIASKSISDNMDKQILKDLKKIVQDMAKDERSNINKQISDVAKEMSNDVAKEISNTPVYNSALDHKFGGVPLRALIQRSR